MGYRLYRVCRGSMASPAIIPAHLLLLNYMLHTQVCSETNHTAGRLSIEIINLSNVQPTCVSKAANYKFAGAIHCMVLYGLTCSCTIIGNCTRG